MSGLQFGVQSLAVKIEQQQALVTGNVVMRGPPSFYKPEQLAICHFRHLNVPLSAPIVDVVAMTFQPSCPLDSGHHVGIVCGLPNKGAPTREGLLRNLAVWVQVANVLEVVER